MRLLRGGEMDRALQYCRECGEHWRAACLRGGCYYHPHFLDPSGGHQEDLNMGNRNRGLWMSICYMLANEVLVVQSIYSAALSWKIRSCHLRFIVWQSDKCEYVAFFTSQVRCIEVSWLRAVDDGRVFVLGRLYLGPFQFSCDHRDWESIHLTLNQHFRN